MRDNEVKVNQAKGPRKKTAFEKTILFHLSVRLEAGPEMALLFFDNLRLLRISLAENHAKKN